MVSLIDDCHLRDRVHPHALDRLRNWNRRRQTEIFFLEMAARDQVADIAVDRTLDEAVVHHPKVIEHLGEVLGAVVADKRNDALGFLLFTAISKRRSEKRANR